MAQSNDYVLDKEKYYKILETDGISAAVNALHLELWEIEFECFEGPNGYSPELFEKLKEYRNFSLELWDKKLIPGYQT